MLQHKPHIISWIKDVVNRAKTQNKKLVAFSHFPMTDFYDMAEADIKQLFGKNKLQLRRLPLLSTAQALADTGLQLHVGGHMHINDTGTISGQKGNVLFNIQAPTLAAYRPAYKLMTLNQQVVDVETVVLEDVQRFDELFPLYRKEHQFLRKNAPKTLWDSKILGALNYDDFTDLHLQALIRRRYLPNEWPAELSALLDGNSFSHIVMKISAPCIKAPSEIPEIMPLFDSNLSGTEIIRDFYRLRNADSIARVSDSRRRGYQALSAHLGQCKFAKNSPEWQFALLMKIISKFSQAQPSDHIRIDLTSGSLKALN